MTSLIQSMPLVSATPRARAMKVPIRAATMPMTIVATTEMDYLGRGLSSCCGAVGAPEVWVLPGTRRAGPLGPSPAWWNSCAASEQVSP